MGRLYDFKSQRVCAYRAWLSKYVTQSHSTNCANNRRQHRGQIIHPKKVFRQVYVRLAFDQDIIYVENHWNQMYHEILSIYSFSFSIVLDAPFFLDTLHYNTQSIHAHSLIQLWQRCLLCENPFHSSTNNNNRTPQIFFGYRFAQYTNTYVTLALPSVRQLFI